MNGMDAATQALLDDVKAKASALAVALRDASDAGVPHGLILPQLVIVFREAFGEMPANVTQMLAGIQE